MTVMDFTSDKEKRIEQEANRGVSVGPVFDALVAELIDIGRRYEFTVVKNDGSGVYDNGDRHKRAREIGEMLDRAGGIDLMQAAWYSVKALGRPAKGDARDLSRCWNGVGE